MDNSEKNKTNPETEKELEVTIPEEDTEAGAAVGLTGWKKELLEWGKSIVIAFVVAWLLNTYVLNLARVSGPSMLPTLQDGNMLYVNKLMYTPKKGDVVILNSPVEEDKLWVKRVIATEGDRLYIDFKTGDVWLNGKILDEPYIDIKTHHFGNYINELMMKGEYSKEKPIVIEKGKVFLMGDNRHNEIGNSSYDCRAVGQIPVENIRGHVVFRFWPLNKIGGIK